MASASNSLAVAGAGHNYYLVIVGRTDNPIYELEYSTKGIEGRSDNRYLTQFVAHAALDLIEEVEWTTNSMYLKNVDKFNEWLVFGFTTASRVRFLLLLDAPKLEEKNIKDLFTELYDVYTKFALNPLYEHNTPIKSIVFDRKVQGLVRKYLP